jgi:predicted DNA-binding WGR domain protein
MQKSTFPTDSGPDDYECFGPPATKDTEFDGTMLAEMGCFQQEEVDSNKFYFCCVTKNRKTSQWFMYVEYGRVGASNPQFQFTEANSQEDAARLYVKQCHEKNTKRGEWQTVSGINLFRPITKGGKPKDLYVVRNLAKRDVGLPHGRSICSDDAAPKKAPKSIKKSKSSKPTRDPHTLKLMRDLIGGAVSYTRSSIEGGNIPSQRSLDDGRAILDAALNRLPAVGDDVANQVNDHELKQLTYALYGMLPKKKPLGAAEDTWILSSNNITAWQQDIDAFESALKNGTVEVEKPENDPMNGMPFDLEWIDPKSDLGTYLYAWWPKATTDRRRMEIKNLWKVNRHGDNEEFEKQQTRILSDIKEYKGPHRALHQDKSRPDLSAEEQKTAWKSNTALLFHGTRSCNTVGILRENLRLPKTLVGVRITGAMFGGGNYFADSWMKSAGYTSSPYSRWANGDGGIPGRAAFMFGCDVVLGNPHLAPRAHPYTAYPKGCHVIFGKGGGTSGIVNNEWITFDRKPLLRYLCEFSWT